MALVGAIINMGVSIVLPCICCMKIFELHQKWGCKLMIIAGLIVIGISIGILGTYPAFKEMIRFSVLVIKHLCCSSKLKSENRIRISGKTEGIKAKEQISELPEDIMVRIVSLLPLKEAAATSILSKRWRNIWTFTTNLDFHDEQTLNYLFNLPREDYHTLINHARLKYIDGVNRVITKLSSKTNNTLVGGLINRFRINFDLCRSFSYSIDNWIEFAMKNRVQVLELLFYRCGGLGRMPDSWYTLGKNHFDPKTLKSLRVLNLASVDISGEVLEWLLSNCPLLERLQVAGSDGNLVNLRILGVPLKHLEIRGCCIRKLEILDAQNLVSLHIQTTYCFRTFVLRNVPKLVDLFFDINFSLDGEHLGRNFSLLSSCLSQLQILHLDLSIYVINYL
nr:F-box/LRR-repeat protein 25-like [Ziziphus jujuba var. spinosa]